MFASVTWIEGDSIITETMTRTADGGALVERQMAPVDSRLVSRSFDSLGDEWIQDFIDGKGV